MPKRQHHELGSQGAVVPCIESNKKEVCCTISMAMAGVNSYGAQGCNANRRGESLSFGGRRLARLSKTVSLTFPSFSSYPSFAERNSRGRDVTCWWGEEHEMG